MHLCIWAFTGQRQGNSAASRAKGPIVSAWFQQSVCESAYLCTRVPAPPASRYRVLAPRPDGRRSDGAPKTLGCRTSRRWAHGCKVGRSNVPVDQVQAGSMICADLSVYELVSSQGFGRARAQDQSAPKFRVAAASWLSLHRCCDQPSASCCS